MEAASATRCPSRASSLSRNSGPPSRPSTTRPSSPSGAAQCRVTSSVLGSRAALTTSAQATSRGAAPVAIVTALPSRVRWRRAAQSTRKVTGSRPTSVSSAFFGLLVSSSTTSRSRNRLPPACVAADPHDLDPLERGAGRHDRVGHPRRAPSRAARRRRPCRRAASRRSRSPRCRHPPRRWRSPTAPASRGCRAARRATGRAWRLHAIRRLCRGCFRRPRLAREVAGVFRRVQSDRGPGAPTTGRSPRRARRCRCARRRGPWGGRAWS